MANATILSGWDWIRAQPIEALGEQRHAARALLDAVGLLCETSFGKLARRHDQEVGKLW